MNSSNIIYRNANINDISSIMKIEHSSFSAVLCESEAVFAERIKIFPDGFRIMEYYNEIIGYISSELWEKAEIITTELFTLGHSIKDRQSVKGKELYISSMGLNPDYRSLGLGKTMFDEFIKYIAVRLNNIESIILVVSEKWSNARKIYSSYGFKQIEILKKFFCYSFESPHYEDGIVMRKYINK